MPTGHRVTEEDIKGLLIIKRKNKNTVFLGAKETTSLRELNMMIAGITKVGPENQMLYGDEPCMDNNKTLGEYGSTAKEEASPTVHFNLRDPGIGKFKTIEVTLLSSPPELPYSVKTVVSLQP